MFSFNLILIKSKKSKSKIKISAKIIKKIKIKFVSQKIKKLYKRTSSIKTTNGKRIIKYNFNQNCVGKIKNNK